MKIDRTKYTAHYENGIVVAQWISVEMALDTANGESPLEALDRSQELVQQWYKSKNLPFETNSIPPGPPPVIQIKPEDRRIGVMVEDILSCNDIPTIDSYRLLIKDQTLLQDAYDKRREEIKQAEIADIMRRTNELTQKQ